MPYALKLVQDRKFNPPLDKGIERAVLFLHNNGVETFASCEGGEGHCYHEPTVRFHGDYPEMLRVASLLLKKHFSVRAFRRVHRVLTGTGELAAIFNEVVFWDKQPISEHDTLDVTVDM